MLRKAATLVVASLVLAASTAWSDPGRGGDQADKMLRILRTTNKAQLNQYVPVVFDLKHVNPYAVVRFINRVVSLEEGGFYTFATHEGNSGKILVICPVHQVEGLRNLISVIDVPNLTSSSGSARAYVKMRHRSVADDGFLAAVAAHGQPGNQIVISDPATNSLYLEDTPVAMEGLLADLEMHLDVPTAEVASDVTIYEVDATNDNTVGLDFHAWKNGPGRNLFALGGFGEHERVRGPLQRLHGLDDLAAAGGPSGINLPNEVLFDSGSNILGLPHTRMNARGYNSALYYQVPSAYFDYLSVKGKARIVTKTRLSILNAHQGSISTGEQILYYLTQNGPAPIGGLRPPGFPVDPLGKADQNRQHVLWDLEALFSGDGQGIFSDLSQPDRIAAYPDNRTVVGQVRDRNVAGASLPGFVFDRATGQAVQLNRNIAAAEAGVFLDVIPTIGDNLITLDLAYSVVNLTGFDGEGRPQLASRSETSTVRARDGEEVILGGLTREFKAETTRKVPILGSIPVLGYWFGGEVSQAKRTMVVIVMKNTVVKSFNNLTPEDSDLLAKVRGDIRSPLPKNEYGWDMYFFGGKAKTQ